MTEVQPVTGQLASPGEPIQNIAPSMGQADLLAAGRLQLAFLHQGQSGPKGRNRMLAAVLRQGQAVMHDLGPIWGLRRAIEPWSLSSVCSMPAIKI